MNLRKYMKQGIWALFDKSLAGIYGLVFVIVVMSSLPKSEFGVYSIIFTIASIALLFNKGFILFPMTKYEAEGESQPLLLGTSLIFSIICLSVFSMIVFVSAPFVSAFLHEPQLLKLLRMVPALILGFFFRDFALSYFQARRDVKSLAIVDSVYFLGLSLLFVSMKYFGYLNSAENVLYAHLIFSYISSSAAALLILGKIKIVVGIDKKEIKKIVKFGKFSLSMGIGEIIFYQLDILFLQRFFEPVTVAIYQSAKVLFRMFALLSQSLNLLILPGSSKLYSANRIDDIKELYEKVLSLYWLLLFAFNIVLFFTAPILMKLLNYSESINIFRIFLFLSFFEPLYTISMNILYGIGKAQYAFKYLAISIGVFFLVCMTLIPQFKGYGAAASFGTAIVFLGIAYMLTLNREIGVSITGIFKHIRNFPLVFRELIKQRFV